MKTPSFTQSPWQIVHDGIHWNIVQQDETPICSVSSCNRPPAVTNALANLIRTAPELLLMVHSCMKTLHERIDELHDERRDRLLCGDSAEDNKYQLGRIRALVRKCDSVIGLAERLGDPRP